MKRVQNEAAEDQGTGVASSAAGEGENLKLNLKVAAIGRRWKRRNSKLLAPSPTLPHTEAGGARIPELGNHFCWKPKGKIASWEKAKFLNLIFIFKKLFCF